MRRSKAFHTVDVYFGTDRKPTTSRTNNDRYGQDRHRDGPMEYGKTTISIPRHHKIGVVERPKWYKLEFSEDPKKRVTILNFKKMGAESFFSEVSETAGRTPQKRGLYFSSTVSTFHSMMRFVAPAKSPLTSTLGVLRCPTAGLRKVS